MVQNVCWCSSPQSMYQAAGWSGERKKTHSFPFKETTQKFQTICNFWLHFIGGKTWSHGHTPLQGRLWNIAALCPAKYYGSVNFKKKESGYLGSDLQGPPQNKPWSRWLYFTPLWRGMCQQLEHHWRWVFVAVTVGVKIEVWLSENSLQWCHLVNHRPQWHSITVRWLVTLMRH